MQRPAHGEALTDRVGARVEIGGPQCQRSVATPSDTVSTATSLTAFSIVLS